MGRWQTKGAAEDTLVIYAHNAESWQGSVDAVVALVGTTETKSDNRIVRLETTRLLPKLLKEGLGLEGQAFHNALQGLAERLGDADDDDVASVAVESLKELRSTSPSSYFSACSALGPVLQAQLQKHCLTIEEEECLATPTEPEKIMNLVNPEKDVNLLGCRENNGSSTINSEVLRAGDHIRSQVSESASVEHLSDENAFQPPISPKMESPMLRLSSEENEPTREVQHLPADEVTTLQPAPSLSVETTSRLVSKGGGENTSEAQQSVEAILQPPPFLTVETGSWLQSEGTKSSNVEHLSDEVTFVEPPQPLEIAKTGSWLLSEGDEPLSALSSSPHLLSNRDSCISSCSPQESSSSLLTDLLRQCSDPGNGEIEINPFQVKQAIDALEPTSDLLPRLPLLLSRLCSVGDHKLDIDVFEAICSIAERSEASILLSCVVKEAYTKKDGDVMVAHSRVSLKRS